MEITGQRYIQSSFFDITKQKIAEEKLRLEHEQLLSIYESITEPICVTDIDSYEIIFSNTAFIKHFGEINTVQCHKHLHDNADPCPFCPIPFLKENELETYYWEYENQLNNHWYRCVDKIIKWPDGKRVHFQLAVDITAAKLTEKELIIAKERAEEADRLKSTFLANMSHEIRTPMNAISGFTDILLRTEYDRERQIEFLNIIQQRSHYLLQIINDILDISRIEAGELKLYESQGDLNTIFEEIFNYYYIKESVSDNHKPIELHKKMLLSPEEGLTIADFTRVKQIINNLLDNAFKFTKRGVIEFGCLLNNPTELLFYVKDTGIGIPAEKQSMIFDRFTQADTSYLTRQTGGTGLGLSICKGLVQLMKGRIWLESEANNGAAFYFTIPYKSVNKPQEIIPQKKDIPYQWDNKKILLVEDDPHNATLILEYLTNTKAICLYARTGLEALELFSEYPDIDLVLLDIRLPDNSGIEITKRMKLIRPNVIIIAQTAYAYDNEKEKSLASGCDEFISKPIYRQKLLKLINDYFDPNSNIKAFIGKNYK